MHRFVLKGQHARQITPDPVAIGVQLHQLGSGLRDGIGDERRLIEFMVVVGEGHQRRVCTGQGPHPGGYAGDGGGVQPARQMYANRHIAAHVQRDGILEQCREALHRIGHAYLGKVLQTPIWPLSETAIRLELETMRSRNLFDAEKEGLRGVVQPTLDQIVGDAIAVEFGAGQARSTQGLDFGCQQCPRTIGPTEQRLDAEAVTRAKHAAPHAVDDDEGPHAVQAHEAGRPPLGISVKQHLGIAGRFEAMPRRLQLRSQLEVIEDFAVEHDGVAPVGAGHRLVPVGRQIQDGQTPEAQRRELVICKAFIVRSAVVKRRQHAAHHRRAPPGIALAGENHEAAHDQPASTAWDGQSGCRKPRLQ
ncbi:MAG: hypothetical protein IOMNBAOH_00500 [Rhodocyclaceae bacterium]|nr:hypothetical protein [Rhodocyclaceae bacterium]